jgi:hypothetical protein
MEYELNSQIYIFLYYEWLFELHVNLEKAIKNILLNKI